MIPFVIIVPLAIAGGGLIGLVEERFRQKRLPKAILDVTDPDDTIEQDPPIMASGDLVQIKHSTIAARVALGLTAIGGMLSYPAMILVSLPVIGYSAYNWMRTRYLFEEPWFKSPLRILAILALISSIATGYWFMAALVLSVDLAARKWLAKFTEGSHLLEVEVPENDGKPSTFMQRVKYLTRIVLQGEPKWEWFPALLARVSMGLFFAISGWNKLFTVAHWKGLLAGMIATGLPFPKLMALFLAWFEFIGGSLLTVGFMSTFFSIGLAFAMIVAIITVEIPFVIPPGLGPLDWLDWFLYLPQVLYVLIFLWLVIKGPGPYSVDAIIARKLGVDKESEEILMLEVDKNYDDSSGDDIENNFDADNDSGKSFGFSLPALFNRKKDLEEDSKENEPKLGGASWTPLHS